MSESVCTYAETRGELLVAYLYEEIEPDERAAFDRHMAACARCRAELNAFRGVRDELERWSPPELSVEPSVARSFGKSFALPPTPAFGVGPIPSAPPVVAPLWTALRQVPAWAQVAAAVLVVGVAAGAANLDVRYTAQGLSVRTGWRRPDPAPPAPTQTTTQTAAQATARADAASAPWRGDLAALEQKLRSDLGVRPVAVPQAPPSEVEESTLRRVRALLQESEQRQRRDLALRVAEMARVVETQRQADLVKIDRNLGLIQSRTGMEVMRTQQQVNSLAQRVSQRQ